MFSRIFYDPSTGDVVMRARGGGALTELTGDDLVRATFNDPAAPMRIGCVEEVEPPAGLALRRITRVDVARVVEYDAALADCRSRRASCASMAHERALAHVGADTTDAPRVRQLLDAEARRLRGEEARRRAEEAALAEEIEGAENGSPARARLEGERATETGRHLRAGVGAARIETAVAELDAEMAAHDAAETARRALLAEILIADEPSR